MKVRMRTALALVAMLLAQPGVMRGQGKDVLPGPSKNAVTAKTWEGLHKLIRPQKGEYQWDTIPWYTSIWDARKAAALEDKPIFIFGTGGAGFNDPLGNC